MKKSFLKGASIFLASVLTVGMCSAYSVNAKAKFSLPKKTTLSYDKKDNGGNGFYTNVIYIKGTNRSNSESILRNGMKVKSSNKKVISTKTFGKDYYLIADNNQVGIGVKLKKTGSTKITAKFKYKGKTYSVKTTVKVIKYSNPFKKIVVDGRDCTADFKNKHGSGISFMGRNIKITPNKNWRVKSIYTYKPGATKMKRVKGSSVTIPTNCRAFITMENKKNKLTEKVTFDEIIQYMQMQMLNELAEGLEEESNNMDDSQKSNDAFETIKSKEGLNAYSKVGNVSGSLDLQL